MEEKEEKSREELLQKKYMDEVACLFPKSFTCPVCDENFKSLAVRKSKMYSLGMDEDLRPKYRWVDPIKYEIIVCPVCGYSAMARYFDEMTPAWRKMLQNGLPSLGIQRGSVEPERLTYDEALKQFELACKCNELVAFKESRKAYTFLKRGWVIRGKILDEQDFLSKEELDKLKKTEKQCLSIAYVGFVKALSEEDFLQLPTRVLAISPETRTANAIGDLGGAIEDMPPYCVTIGFRQIFTAKKVRLGVFRDWHRAVVRRAAYGAVTSAFPVTLLQRHPDALIYVNANAAKCPANR